MPVTLGTKLGIRSRAQLRLRHMKLRRREVLRWTVGIAGMPFALDGAAAQGYPTRPVRFMVGFAPGAGPDIIARLTADWLTQRFGQPFIVEDRPGAAGNIATADVIRAAPDGYTLLHVTVANAIHPRLSNGAWFPTDIAPVAGVARASFFLVVNPSLPIGTVPELVAYAKANPGKIAMGSSSVGTAPYLAGKLFKIMTGIDLLQVPYNGTPQAITELLGGRVQSVLADPSAVELIKAGKLRALGVTAAARQEILPAVPSIGEFVTGYEASTWHGLGAPSKVDPEIVAVLNKEINGALNGSAIKSRLARIGCTVIEGSPSDFGRLIADETAKWRKVLEAANVR